MSCYHPLLYNRSDLLNPETGKFQGYVSRWIPPEERIYDGHYTYIDIPCGKCIGCRLEYAQNWANRMSLEASLWPSDRIFFLTMTYDNMHLPVVVKDGVLSSTLVKRHVQLFMKRLRFHFAPDKIRFFCSGEYGDKTNRPHYHAIVFGLPLNDLVFYSRSAIGNNYYNSPTLDKLWDQGFVVVSQANWQTMNYTARYVVKKLRGFDAIAYKMSGIEPPFSLMSNRPGIGAGAYDPEMFSKSCIVLSNGRTASIPRYFKKILERSDPDMAKELSDLLLLRSDVRYNNLSKVLQTDYKSYLDAQEFVKNSAISFLNSTKSL